MKQFRLYTILLITLLMASCSVSDDVVTGRWIQKRKYTKGFYFSTKGKANKVRATENKSVNDDVVSYSAPVAQKDAEALADLEANNLTEQFQQIAPDNLTADNSGHFDEQNTAVPAIHLKSPDVVTIIQPAKKSEIKFHKKVDKKVQRLQKKKSSKSPGFGTNQLIALLLVIFVGVLGIHRMYLGYYLIGIIQLLTLGGCGIWALIDFVRILIGDLKPIGGGYTETLDDLF